MTIKLLSNDGQVFEIDQKVAQMSETIQDMIKLLSDVNGGSELPIDLPAAVLGKVLEWAQHHQNDPPLVEPVDLNNEVLSTWDEDFLSLEHGMLFDLLNATDYLNMRPMMNACARKVANLIRGKTAPEIRQLFDIEIDDDQEEEEDEQLDVAMPNSNYVAMPSSNVPVAAKPDEDNLPNLDIAGNPSAEVHCANAIGK